MSHAQIQAQHHQDDQHEQQHDHQMDAPADAQSDSHSEDMSQEATSTDRRDLTPLPELEDLAEQIGEFIHYWGFKRVHGRIWTHLFLADRPLDAADLVRRMKLSKAPISISLRELLDYDVIQEVGKSPRGTHVYRTNPDILSVIMAVLRQREKRMLSRIQAAQDGFDKVRSEERQAWGLSDRASGQLRAMISQATSVMDAMLMMEPIDFGHWRESLIIVDPKEEAELRARSVVAPPSRHKSRNAGGEAATASQAGSGGTSAGKGEPSEAADAVPKTIAATAAAAASGFRRPDERESAASTQLVRGRGN